MIARWLLERLKAREDARFIEEHFGLDRYAVRNLERYQLRVRDLRDDQLPWVADLCGVTPRKLRRARRAARRAHARKEPRP